VTLPRALLDSAVFIYAVGVEHHYRNSCRALVDGLARQAFDGEASVEAVQEFLHQRARRTGDRAQAASSAGHVSVLCVLHDVTVGDLRLALDLFRAHERLHARDALHAATALNRGIGTIISPDDAFEGVDGLQRLDPVAAARRLPQRG